MMHPQSRSRRKGLP